MGHWEKKDSGGAVPVEIKQQFDSLQKLLVDIRAEQKAVDVELKKKGAADVVLTEKVGKMDKGFADLKADIDALFKRTQRSQVTAVDAKSAEFERKGLLEFGQVFMGGVADIERLRREHAGYKSAFSRYIRVGDEKLNETEKKAMTTGDAPGGGYWVEPFRSDQIIRKMYETSELRSLCQVVTINTQEIVMPVRRDKGTVNWVGETSTRSATTTPQIGQLRVRVHEMQAQPAASQNMLDDSTIDVEAFLNEDIALTFGLAENTTFVVGDGVKQPRGFLTLPTASTADATRPFGTIQFVATGSSGAFPASNPTDKLIDLVYAFKSPYRPNLRWGMNRLTLAAVRKFKDGQGNYIAGPRLTDKGVIEQVLEYPVSELADMPDMAANSLSVVLADWRKAYLIVDRQGIRQLRDPFSSKPFVIYDTTKRVGGDVLDTDAIKLLKFA